MVSCFAAVIFIMLPHGGISFPLTLLDILPACDLCSGRVKSRHSGGTLFVLDNLGNSPHGSRADAAAGSLFGYTLSRLVFVELVPVHSNIPRFPWPHICPEIFIKPSLDGMGFSPSA